MSVSKYLLLLSLAIFSTSAVAAACQTAASIQSAAWWSASLGSGAFGCANQHNSELQRADKAKQPHSSVMPVSAVIRYRKGQVMEYRRTRISPAGGQSGGGMGGN